MVYMVGECQTQKPVNFMTRSQQDNLHHGQAVRKAVFGRVFRLPERRTLSVTCLAKSLCPKALNTKIASLKKPVAIRHNNIQLR